MPAPLTHVVFHGANAASFAPGFVGLLGAGYFVQIVPDELVTAADRATYAAADVIIGSRFHRDLPRAEKLTLFHVPGAGYDGVDLAALPPGATVCNCFGHEQAIAEYVMTALLARHVPLVDADARLRQGDWAYWAGAADRIHDEIAGKTIGLLGYGHIGQAIARRAKAFEMRVHVANRTPVKEVAPVDRYYDLDHPGPFWMSADYFVVSLPLAPSTAGIVGAAAFNAMKRSAVLVNVGRGATVDEQALYDALASERIAGAIIDTWYAYPSPQQPHPQPSTLPFNKLSNVLMTPHMSGWTSGTIYRRQKTMAANILKHFAGEPCDNVVRPAAA